VPLLNSRYRIPLDNQGATTAGFITSAISGISGTTWGASGGSQSMQAHVHTTSISDPGHQHSIPINSVVGASGGGLVAAASGASNTGSAFTNIGVTVNTAGSGGSQNIPPGLVFGFSFIKS
jgi:hypothetical protein